MANITGTYAADNLVGGFGDDVINGLDGNDIIDGQAGSDTIRGGDGDDVIEGNFGNDNLYGDGGNDTITDDQGSNILDGGSGNDTLTSRSLSGSHTLMGGSGADNLNATGLSVDLDGGDDQDTLYATGYLQIAGNTSYVDKGTAKLNGGRGDDQLSVEQYSSAILNGGDGNDNIYASSSRDIKLYGEAGDDNLSTYINSWYSNNTDGNPRVAKSALLSGGDGNDQISVSGYTNIEHGRVDVTALGGSGSDTISIIDNQAGSSNGSDGKNNGFSSVTIDAGIGRDRITVSGGLNIAITTGSDSDTVVLTAQQYRTLIEGARVIRNSDGSSTVVNAEPITITDFSAGSGGDIIDYGDLLRNGTLTYDGSNPFASGFLVLEQSGSDTLLRFDSDGKNNATKSAVPLVILKNVTASNLIADNFNPNFSATENEDSSSYSISTSSSSVNEGEFLTTTVRGNNVAEGTILYYSLEGSGITSADFSNGVLNGQGSLDAEGKLSFSHTLANDQSTEGTETLQIKLFSDAARTMQVGFTTSITIADTSTGEKAAPPVTLGRRITGTYAADSLVGEFENDIINGLDGNDSIDGQAGSDTIHGGDGDDVIEGNFGNDFLYGDGGNDTITDDQGSNILDGGSGNDSLTSRSLSGSHTLIGSSGSDSLNATGKTVNLDGGDDNDYLYATGQLYVQGSTSFVDQGIATLNGGGGDDSLSVDSYAKATLRGGDGNDYLGANLSTNTALYGDGGDDNLNISIAPWNKPSIDRNQYAPTSALLDGGDGNDQLAISGYSYTWYGRVDLSAHGGSGNDVIAIADSNAGSTNGNDGRNSGFSSVNVDGGSGRDRITVSGGLRVAITTGSDSDTIVLTAQQYRTLTEGARVIQNTDGSSTVVNPEPVVITDFSPGAGGDILDYGDLLRNGTLSYDGSNPFASGFLILEQSGTDTLLRFDPDGSGANEHQASIIARLNNTLTTKLGSQNFNPNFGTPFADTIVRGDDDDEIDALDGDDIIDSGGGNDTIDGGDGDDIINGGSGNDLIQGGEGTDTARFHRFLPGFLFDPSGGEAIDANLLAGVASGAEIGTNTLIAIENIETADGDDTLIGNDLDNRLVGNGGNDNLQGNDGNDVFIGGQGDDTISGGLGTDEAIYSGIRENYTVTNDASASTISLKDNRQFHDGTDTITGVETFKFADLTLTLAELIGNSNLTSEKSMDLNGDGIINQFDSMLLMRHMLGTFPGENIKNGVPGSFDLGSLHGKLQQVLSGTFSLGGRLKLDIDGDSIISAFSDGLAITSYIQKQEWESMSPWAPPSSIGHSRSVGDLQNHLKDLIGF
jgi:Ca2+-binding RTX toxin-like protein